MDEPRTERRRRLREAACALIARHYRRALTLERVALALGVSVRELQRAFAAAGTTFAEELRRARLAAAAELLAGQPIPVGDVALLVGYREAAWFASVFRRRYGLTPARYRAAARRGGAAVSSPPTTATGPGS